MQEIDFKRFREIADKVGAYLMVDMAHIAGLVAAVFTRARFRMRMLLRQPLIRHCADRGGLILANKEAAEVQLQQGDFPGNPGRSVRAHHRWQGGLLRRGAEARNLKYRFR